VLTPTHSTAGLASQTKTPLQSAPSELYLVGACSRQTDWAPVVLLGSRLGIRSDKPVSRCTHSLLFLSEFIFLPACADERRTPLPSAHGRASRYFRFRCLRVSVPLGNLRIDRFHRTHMDRPLFEMHKNGCPITQCNHCRDLRKVQPVHMCCGCRKEAGWMGKCSSEHGVPSSSSRTCNITHPSNSYSLGKSKNAIDLIVNEGHTECKCDETGICPCAIPQSKSSSLQTLQTPSSPHMRSCHGSIG